MFCIKNVKRMGDPKSQGLRGLKSGKSCKSGAENIAGSDLLEV